MLGPRVRLHLRHRPRFCCWRPIALLSALTITAGLSGCAAKGYRFVVPDGFAGSVRIDFGVPTSPRLPVQDGLLVVRVPRDGVVQTPNSIRAPSATSSTRRSPEAPSSRHPQT
ncbi:DUF6843 domain-containing protein [Anaeromyxobacter terrae]|uniref:DUF6843 domain-containing protein n=1 Tax=Anaeromyxobacter terrae TaxID=2925406 RepID=UPI0038CBF48A